MRQSRRSSARYRPCQRPRYGAWSKPDWSRPTCVRCGSGSEPAPPRRVRGRGPEYGLEQLRALERIATDRGGELLSRAYVNSSTKGPPALRGGPRVGRRAGEDQGRPVVSDLREAAAGELRSHRALERLREIVARHEGHMLTPYVASEEKVRFRCAQGHEWDAVPNSIQRGSWCRRCAIAARSVDRKLETMQRLRAVASERGGEVLSPRFVGAHEPMRFRCGAGHEWRTAPTNVMSGSWCPHCVVSPYHPQYTIDDMRELAESYGGRCVSRRFRSTNDRLRWCCAQGHKWEALPASVLAGTWCRRCFGSVRGESGTDDAACSRPGWRVSVPRVPRLADEAPVALRSRPRVGRRSSRCPQRALVPRVSDSPWSPTPPQHPRHARAGALAGRRVSLRGLRELSDQAALALRPRPRVGRSTQPHRPGHLVSPLRARDPWHARRHAGPCGEAGWPLRVAGSGTTIRSRCASSALAATASSCSRRSSRPAYGARSVERVTAIRAPSRATLRAPPPPPRVRGPGGPSVGPRLACWR